MDKKAQMNTNSSVGMILTLIIGVGVAVLVLIFVGVLGGQTYQLVEDDLTFSSGVINETYNASTFSGFLNNNDIQVGTLTIRNGTATEPLSSFTINYQSGSIQLTATGVNNTIYNVSYTHGNLTIENAIRGGIVNSFESLETTGNYTSMIVLAVVIAIVLGMVLSFGMIGGKLGGGAL